LVAAGENYFREYRRVEQTKIGQDDWRPIRIAGYPVGVKDRYTVLRSKHQFTFGSDATAIFPGRVCVISW